VTHPLDGALLRAERADRHIGEAQQLVTDYARKCDAHVVVTYDKGTGEPRPLRFESTQFPAIPLLLPLAISDAVHNLRASLDYVVFELARKENPNADRGRTQFPITDHKVGDGGFDKRSNRELAGLSRAHIGAIEGLQPYNGVEWTRTLRDVSNPDKHESANSNRAPECWPFDNDLSARAWRRKVVGIRPHASSTCDQPRPYSAL
jgi:hypothetical protein